jgi:hypothetical protein
VPVLPEKHTDPILSKQKPLGKSRAERLEIEILDQVTPCWKKY